jgi:hypothetical protein
LISLSRKFLLLAPILLIAAVSSASSVNGTYVNHGANFAEMLQLTEKGNGQLTGFLRSMTLKEDGTVKLERSLVTGTVGGGQITLAIESEFLSCLVGSTFSGTVSGGTITLKNVDTNGNSCVFVPGTPATFTEYANELKSRGSKRVLNRQLKDEAIQFHQTVETAEAWIAAAESHAKEISGLKSRYQEIEERMQSSIAEERAAKTRDARGQISVKVSQDDIAGTQIDTEVNQLWDSNIADSGSALNVELSKRSEKCTEAAELKKHGATADSAEMWETACKRVSVERDKFIPIFQHIMEQRAEVKSLEVAAQARRKALVAESNRVE